MYEEKKVHRFPEPGVTNAVVRCLSFMCPRDMPEIMTQTGQIDIRGAKTLTNHAYFGMFIERLKK